MTEFTVPAETDEAVAAEIAAAADQPAGPVQGTPADPAQPIYLSTGSGPIRNFDLGGRTGITVEALFAEASIRPAPGTRIYASGALVSDLGQEIHPGELVTLAANKEAGA